MTKKYVYLTSILVLMMSATIAVYGQELNASDNNAALNNSTSNSGVNISANITTQNSTPANVTNLDNITTEPALSNASLSDVASNDNAVSQIAQNLSTMGNKPLVAVSISEIAKIAPEVAAGASSAQASTKLEDAYKLGSGVGGLDQFNPKHEEIESLKLDLSIKPMRDTSKLFFVCDIV